MKKIVYIPLMALATLFFGVSCSSPQAEDVFEKSASERISSTIEEYRKLLTSSEHGWIFENYPGGSSQNFGGFTHTLKFTDNQVVASIDLNSGTHTSTYKIIQYGGAMLSFDENNPNIHAFSEPDRTYTNGFEGDFEFIFMSHTQDEIFVKGRRYNDLLRMIRLKEPAADYIAKVQKISTIATLRGVLSIKVEGKEVDFSVQGRIFSYKDAEGKSVVVPFHYTDKGIRFYKPIDINGKKIQELIFNEAEVTFADTDGLFSVTLFTPSPIDFANSRWRFFVKNSEQASDKIRNQYNEVHALLKNEVPNIVLDLWDRYMFGNSDQGSAQGVGLYFWNNNVTPGMPAGYGFPTMYHLDFHGDSKNPNLLYMKGKLSSAGPNLEPLLKIRQLFLDNSPYLVEKTTNPKVVKLTSQKDPEIWMVMEKYWPL